MEPRQEGKARLEGGAGGLIREGPGPFALSLSKGRPGFDTRGRNGWNLCPA